MAELASEDFDRLEDYVREEFPGFPVLVNKFFDVDGSYSRLLNIGNLKPVSISRDERRISLDEPLYVRRFEVYSKDVAATLKSFEVKVEAPSGEIIPLVGSLLKRVKADGTQESYIAYMVKGFIKSVVVRGNVPLRRLKLLRVSIHGYSLGHLESISQKITKSTDVLYRVDSYVKSHREEVESARLRLEEFLENEKVVKEALGRLTEEKENISLMVESSHLENSNQIDKLNKVNASLQVAEEALNAVRNNESQLKETVGGLNVDISQKTKELQALVNDRNLISDEYRDYVSEGAGQSLKYVGLMVIPILVIGFCSWQLYFGAKSIISSDVDNLNQLFALFLQRIPFAAALGLIVTVCWKLASALMGRIMKIHGDRLALAKLLVIAKDVVYSSSADLELNEEEKLRHRMQLKLEMLKSHLSAELDSGFLYVSRRSIGESQAEVKGVN